ncbi:MAG TPA: GNAT family N-acetyltransferase [Acidimicrobiia bacterium]|jgi:GNAT superfamily N-acetyltransferase|nr:GNAT family N-acetyltransferase [Acidimicrobiia bacterium]
MPTTTCPCGTTVEGADREALAAAMVEHCGIAHPEWGLSTQAALNFLDAFDRLTGPTARLDTVGPIEVRPAASCVADVVSFFDHDAFADNPGWASCYCRCHHVAAEGWGDRPAARNRDELESGLRDGAMTGFVATVGGRVAGWCNASRRATMPRHRDDTSADDQTASVVCFVVAPPYRGHGVARELLATTIEALRASGATAVEAYPLRNPADGAAAYHGTVGMFEAAGFDVTRDDDHGIVMRRTL